MYKRILALMLCLVLVCTMALSFRANADFGDFSGDSDYGGSDWGGGGGGSGWSSSDSGSSSGDTEWIWDMLVWLIALFFNNGWPGIGAFVGLIALLIIVQIIRSRLRGRRKKSKPMNPGAQRTAQSSLRSLAEYHQLDPGFDAVEMTKQMSNWYVQMQNSWCSGDISSVRPFFSDAYFAQMERQLNQMKQAGRTAHVERIAVLGVELRGFYQSGGQDHMVAQLRTRIVDYTTDASGAIVSGSNKLEKFMTYEWVLTRPTGTKTKAEAEMTVINCPNCGASLNINATAKCPYCDSVITINEHDWVISQIKGLSQRTGGR